MNTKVKTLIFFSSVCLLTAWSCPVLANPKSQAQSERSEDILPRRAFFGAHLSPLNSEIRKRWEIDSDGGVFLERIISNSSAAHAGLIAKDIILRLNGSSVDGVDALREQLGEAHAGEELMLDIIRQGTRLEKKVILHELPRYKDDYFDLNYGQVISNGVKLRTLVGSPKTTGPHPAVILLQGSGNFSIDNPTAPATSFTRIARHLSRNGYVTMRVDRRGCGDSEGAPTRDMDFLTELDGYRQALAALRKFEFVDQRNIFIFGHSLGGMTGPILASETPVRGVATYGTIAGTWFEGIMAQRRRFATLDGTDPAEVEKRIEREMQFWYPLLVEKLTPKQIRESDPRVAATMDELKIGKTHIFDRPYTWLHQVSGINMGEIWTKVANTPLKIEGNAPVYPSILSIWGKADWISEKDPILWIDEVVNRARPGSGNFIALDSSDHFFFQANSIQESYQYYQPAPGGPYGKFNPAILNTLRTWLKKTTESS